MGWMRDRDGWCCHLRIRDGGDWDTELFVRYDPALIIPVTIPDDGRWWLPDLPKPPA